jgi:hypothetical protein
MFGDERMLHLTVRRRWKFRKCDGITTTIFAILPLILSKEIELTGQTSKRADQTQSSMIGRLEVTQHLRPNETKSIDPDQSTIR